jgi:hypothetical protein
MGYYTVVLSALVGPGGWVHALESNPRAYRLLVWNREVNGCGNTTTYLFAAGENSRRIMLAVPIPTADVLRWHLGFYPNG